MILYNQKEEKILILYHGSKEIVEFPEIRKENAGQLDMVEKDM